MSFERPKLVVSKCLEFGHCRFDGSMIGCKEVSMLKEYVDFLPFCPEMGIGLPSPRESLRLVLKDGEHRLVMTKSGIDQTGAMQKFSEKSLKEIKAFGVDGFVLKGASPSCGTKEVRLYPSIGKVAMLSRKSKGIFGEIMMENYPNLLFEDEGRLSNFTIREHFYTAIFTKADFRRVKKLHAMKELVQFHGKNKYLFMAYSKSQLTVLGKIVANHEKLPLDDILNAYEENLDRLFKKNPTSGQFVNVMLHIFGYFSKELSAKEKAYFLDALESYRNKHIPQSTVMGVLWAWVLRFDDPYLLQQTVFEPFPKKLIQVTDSGKGL
ncbi:MAG: DUF1722 domain-containing protein [Vallitaleaceae bacterium]|nr:DUF1722 domain-containing protein [Vallitaleaceae bacterium]